LTHHTVILPAWHFLGEVKDMDQTVVHPFMGGIIEEDRARKFTGQDRMTGQPQEISLPDRVAIVFGKKKAYLSGDMVIALVNLYNGKDEFSKGFREWCKQCK
jgi:hypothetical protein